MRGSLVRIARVLKCRSFVSGGWLSCLTCRWANNAMLQRTTNSKQVDWCDPQHFLNVLVASSLHLGSRCFLLLSCSACGGPQCTKHGLCFGQDLGLGKFFLKDIMSKTYRNDVFFTFLLFSKIRFVKLTVWSLYVFQGFFLWIFDLIDFHGMFWDLRPLRPECPSILPSLELLFVPQIESVLH